jgi:hypothetical protein
MITYTASTMGIYGRGGGKKPLPQTPFTELEQIAFMRSIIARFDLQQTLDTASISVICNRIANPITGAVGKPVTKLIDRMLANCYLVELPTNKALHGEMRRFVKGDIELEDFKNTFREEISEYEQTRNRIRVWQQYQ